VEGWIPDQVEDDKRETGREDNKQKSTYDKNVIFRINVQNIEFLNSFKLGSNYQV